MNKPLNVNILGINYSITYVDNPSDVDIYKHDSIWGQIDFWTRSIRIYDKDLSNEDVWHSLLHEVMHGIVEELRLHSLDSQNEQAHEDLDLLALALNDVLFRNGWINR